MTSKEEMYVRLEEMLVSAIIDADTARKAMDCFSILLNDYEVEKRVTDVVPYDDADDRMIKRYVACMKLDGKSDKTIAH